MSCALGHSARASRGAACSGPALLSLSAASYTAFEQLGAIAPSGGQLLDTSCLTALYFC